MHAADLLPLLEGRPLPVGASPLALARLLAEAQPQIVPTPESSCFTHHGYDRARMVLEVRFRRPGIIGECGGVGRGREHSCGAEGEEHRFTGVTPDVYSSFAAAPSRGRAFAEMVKGRYFGVRMPAPAAEPRGPIGIGRAALALYARAVDHDDKAASLIDHEGRIFHPEMWQFLLDQAAALRDVAERLERMA